MDRFRATVEKRIAPVLARHGGGIDLASFADGVLRVRLLGQCAGCPSAAVTAEQLIEAELKQAHPELRRVTVVQEVSDELWQAAKQFLCGARTQR